LFDQRDNPAMDVIADLSYRVDALSRGIVEFPVEVDLTWEVGPYVDLAARTVGFLRERMLAVRGGVGPRGRRSSAPRDPGSTPSCL
jgi:hypothetical protein